MLTAPHIGKKWWILAGLAAAIALSDIGLPAEGVVPALREALNDKEEDVRQAAAEALKKIQQVGASTRRRRAQHK